MPNDGFIPSLPEMVLARVSDTIYPSLSDLFRHHAPTGARSYKHLAILIFVISNDLFDPDQAVDIFGLLAASVYQLPSDILLNIFQSHSLSVRAVWDIFLSRCIRPCIQELERRKQGHQRISVDAISSFISLVWSIHPDWIVNGQDDLVILAASLGRPDWIRRLLAQGAKASHCDRSDRITAMLSATIMKDYESLRLLSGNCDINARHLKIYIQSSQVFNIRKQREVMDSKVSVVIVSEFDLFLDYLSREFRSYGNTNGLSRLLEILLHSGANVDAPFPLELCGLREAYDESQVRSDWLPTCLDVGFYLCDQIHAQMHTWSRRFGDLTLLTREGICHALTRGWAALEHYLYSRTAYSAAEKGQLLELILLEHFFVRQHLRGANLDTKEAEIIRRLLDFGVGDQMHPFRPWRYIVSSLDDMVLECRGVWAE